MPEGLLHSHARVESAGGNSERERAMCLCESMRYACHCLGFVSAAQWREGLEYHMQ